MADEKQKTVLKFGKFPNTVEANGTGIRIEGKSRIFVLFLGKKVSP